MEYYIVATTRDHCDMGDPKVAKSFEDSYQKLIDLKKSGTVKMAFLSGPFTAMKINIIIEAKDHDEAYGFITRMPCWCYMDNALYPVIHVERAIEGIRAITRAA